MKRHVLGTRLRGTRAGDAYHGSDHVAPSTVRLMSAWLYSVDNSGQTTDVMSAFRMQWFSRQSSASVRWARRSDKSTTGCPEMQTTSQKEAEQRRTRSGSESSGLGFPKDNKVYGRFATSPCVLLWEREGGGGDRVIIRRQNQHRGRVDGAAKC